MIPDSSGAVVGNLARRLPCAQSFNENRRTSDSRPCPVRLGVSSGGDCSPLPRKSTTTIKEDDCRTSSALSNNRLSYVSFGERVSILSHGRGSRSSDMSLCVSDMTFLSRPTFCHSHVDGSTQTPTLFDGLSEAAIQTSTLLMESRGVETWLCWDQDGFRCKRCEKPPQMPQQTAPSLPPKRPRRPSSSVASSASGVASSTGDSCCSSVTNFSLQGIPDPENRNAHPEFTTYAGMIRSVILLLTRWVVERDPNTCCPWHRAVGAISEVLPTLFESDCQPLFSATAGSQCTLCGIVCPKTQGAQRCAGCTRSAVASKGNSPRTSYDAGTRS